MVLKCCIRRILFNAVPYQLSYLITVLCGFKLFSSALWIIHLFPLNNENYDLLFENKIIHFFFRK